MAPAGDLEKLKIAVHYGADAVYLGGESFSLRQGSGNFNLLEMKEGLMFAHKRGKKVYLAINIFPHEKDLPQLKDYIKKVRELDFDAFIVSDPGVIQLVKDLDPGRELHLSTQANTTNHMGAKFWYKQGIRRIVLARELSLVEIKDFRANIAEDMELEAFVHGAMCISYSGRCLISNFMTGRDANRGQCTHPCRYKYSLVEEKRPGEYYPVEEDDRGTYILNSRDLCMIKYIPELLASGLSSLKIEGRMKSIFYVATVVSAYRKALDSYMADPRNYIFREEWMEELSKASHREFTRGFYFGKPGPEDQNYETSAYKRDYTITGLILDKDIDGIAPLEQRNKMSIGDEIEIMSPKGAPYRQVIEEMWDEEGKAIKEAPHPQERIKIRIGKPVEAFDIIRKEI